jgi:hypothetical protein
MNHGSFQCSFGLSATLVAFTATVQADVTIQQKTSLDVASIVRLHGATTTSIAADKKREDHESHCEGIMSLLCGNAQSGEIVRLDRDVSWHLEPAKKRYREQVFATPEEMAAMRAKMQANLEKMRSCPVSKAQQPIDKSKCEMSQPKIEVHKTDTKMSFAGHEAQKTSATLTETCTNKDTGDICDTVVAVDVWLTEDKLPGSGERRAFDAAYAKKLGLDDPQGIMRGEVAKFLAPYQSQIKQLTDKSSDFKGQPLKTSLRVLMGGRQCGATAKMKANESSGGVESTQGGANSATAGGTPLDSVAQAGKTIGSSVGHLVGGLFHKKKADDSQGAAQSTAGDPGAGQPTAAGASSGATSSGTGSSNAAAPVPSAPDPFAQYVQMAAFSMETVTINTDAVPAGRFDIPPEWTKEATSPTRSVDEYNCPKS